MNEQEAKLTDEMREALPDGARVVYMPGMAYEADRAPVVIVTSGVDARTYTWSTCDACGSSGWCVLNGGDIFGMGVHTLTCAPCADMGALALAIIENVDALLLPNL